MLRIIGLVIAIALGDSLNPSTIGPALYVASGDRARSGVLEFTLAVFLVHFAGGALLPHVLQTARSIRPAPHPASRPRTRASLPATQASPRTGLTPAGRPELIAPTS
jgi:hypothetical protein